MYKLRNGIQMICLFLFLFLSVLSSVVYAGSNSPLLPLWTKLDLATGSTIHITESGFDPATVTVFGPTDVTWINTTAITHTLQSGEPIPNPGNGSNIYVPLIQRGSPAAVEAAAAYLPYLYRTALAAEFSVVLGPGQRFTYAFRTPGAYKYYLASLPTVTGELTLHGVALERTSPLNGAGDVAVTRETVLEFSGPLDPTTVTPAAFSVQAGAESLAYRLNLSPDLTRVTLFYDDALPGSIRVRVNVDGSQLKDAQGNNVDVDGDGAAGGSTFLEFDTLSLTVTPGTIVCGRVFASELAVTASNVSVNTPLQGVVVSVDGLADALRATTDVNGNFCLDPAPAGRFFVHVDGHAATNNLPSGVYYPTVGKAWQSIPGQQTSVGEIYLPLIPANTLQPVSATQDTQITFPDAVLQAHSELNGVSILVPADSLYSDDGARGGKVGIAPVPPDRLPGGLPEGLDFPVVITVQTDGAGNFDTPAPVCFPNLPDPNTQEKLQPDAKAALYSFNHDTGAWEAVGSMTATQDGKLICSDPGAGIRAPGWHGSGPRPYRPVPPQPIPLCRGEDDPVVCIVPKPPPCQGEGDFETCLETCRDTFYAVVERINAALLANADACEYMDPKVPDSPFTKEEHAACTEAANTTAKDQYTKAIADHMTCNASCVNTCPVSTQSTAAIVVSPAQANTDPIVEQLQQIANDLLALLEPFLGTPTLLSEAVIQQIKDLLAQADQIAGGDATAYWTTYLQKQELALGVSYPAGNAPDYPIAYVAFVSRPDFPLFLRGMTGPYGNYTLFVPADGQLNRVDFFDPRTGALGSITPYLLPAYHFDLPRVELALPTERYDSDGDGLLDPAEFVLGTNSFKVDSDGDGINDGAEVAQGTDPLTGILVQTGIVASADTPGYALDLCIHENLAAVADREMGVALFNVFNRATPTLINQIAAPGKTTDVACTNGRVVAVGDAGDVSILDVSNPAAARVTHQVNTGAAGRAVDIAANVAYVGDQSGRLLAFDIQNGELLGQVLLDNPIEDVAAANGLVYTLVQGALHVYSAVADGLNPVGTAPSPGNAGSRRQRLFVGPDIAFATQLSGYNTFDLTDPAAPTPVAVGNTTQRGWKTIVPNGSGLGVAAVGVNDIDPPPDISLYDVSDPAQTNRFLTTIVTPGAAGAVVIHNGLAFVADGSAGVQVINYLADDAKGQPPTVALTSNAPPGTAEEGQLLQLLATVTDDVQVRQVRFVVNGQIAATDGSFPFSHETLVARDAAAVTAQAVAFDTGGNASPPQNLNLTVTPDHTPPQVTRVLPIGGAPALQDVTVYFNEPMNTATITATSLALLAAGADGALGTGDDTPVTGGIYSYRPEANAAVVSFPAAQTAAGVELYQLTASAPLADTAGNPLALPITRTFRAGPGSFWVNETSGSWHDPFHWSGQQLPDAQRAVFIEAPGEIVVTHSQGTTGVASLYSTEQMEITGGSLQASNGIHQERLLLLDGGTLRDATLNLTPGAALVFSNHSQNRLRGMAVDGEIQLATANARFKIEEGLTLTGTLTMQASNGFVELAGSQSIRGGTLIFTQAPSLWSLTGEGALITLEPGTIVRGGRATFSSGQGAQHLVNAGLILADMAGQSIKINTDRFTNTGTVRVIEGSKVVLDGAWRNSGLVRLESGTLELNGTFRTSDTGTIQRTDGTVQLTGNLDNNPAVLLLDTQSGSWFVDGGHINGGTVRMRNGAALDISSASQNQLTGVILDGDMSINRTNARLKIDGGLTISGTLTMQASNGFVELVSSQTIQGGTLRFADNPGTWSLQGADTEVTLAPGTTVQGGRARFSSGLNSQHLVNGGLILADLAGQSIKIDIDRFTNTGTVRVTEGSKVEVGGAWRNSGLFQLESGTLALNGTFRTSDIGTIQRTGGTVQLTGNLDNNAAVLLLDTQSGSWFVDGGHINGGTVRMRNGAALDISSASQNQLTSVILDGDMSINRANARLKIDGGLTISGTLTMQASNGFVELASSQTIQGGVLRFDDNPGTWSLQGAGTEVTLAPGTTVQGGRARFINGLNSQHLINEGLILADMADQSINLSVDQITNRGRMEGKTGKFVATGALTNEGQLAPGRGGIFALTGGYAQTESGQLDVILGGSTPGSGFSQLSISGAASLGGTLSIALASGFDPAIGATFPILTAGSRTGAFTSINGAAIGNGKALQVDYAANGVTLTVIAAP